MPLKMAESLEPTYMTRLDIVGSHAEGLGHVQGLFGVVAAVRREALVVLCRRRREG